ncbi:MAG: molybdenum cofactor guanylyltransferase [Verrucomicrobia bacterium]|nr:molybdenum cofactor guanylyltransferase [Verrucomicrobiota bacterium]
MDFSAVILAGGESRRMGRDKAWLKTDGRTLIAAAVEKARRAGAQEVFISGRSGENYSTLKCPVLLDLEPGFGPLGGIERALHICAAPLLLVLAVDMPYMTADFLQRMAARCDRVTGAVPKLKGRLEPLAAIYPRYCHEIAFNSIAKSHHAVRDFAEACRKNKAVQITTVKPADESCFANWNTPADAAARPKFP